MRVGAVLKDKWRLDALLGVGGMASVYAATHRNNGKRVAVKMLHPELSVVQQIKTRFLREGYAANKVNHPGVVSVLDDDVSEDGSVYLVMELLEGENLEQRRAAAGGKLDLAEVLWITDQMLDVLVAAHAVGIIHRDIKPENIFLTSQATLKVLDFGLARVQPSQPGAAYQSSGLTRTNMLMGTLDFMAPEQARGKWDGVGVQSDLWSVGASVFMLLTGHPVHEEATLESQIKAASSRPARSIRQLRPDLPPPVVALIDRALAYDSKQRWPDALSMQEAVRDAYSKLGGQGGERSPTVRPPTVETPPTRTSESDLARTNALSKIAFDDDDVTRDLNHLTGLSELPDHPDLAATNVLPQASTDGPRPAPGPAPAPSEPTQTPTTPLSIPEMPAPGTFQAVQPPGEPAAPARAPAPFATTGSVPAATASLSATGGRPAATEGEPGALQRHRTKLLIAAPVALLLLVALVASRGCGDAPATAQATSASASASAPPPAASSAPAPGASSAAPDEPPPPAASASATKKTGKPPTRTPVVRPPRKK